MDREPVKIFLAGGTGAIGRVLLALLVEEGHSVIATSRTGAGAERLRAQGATPVLLDFFDRAAVSAALTHASPDVVVHQLTALSGGSLADNARLRREGTRNLVDASRAAGVRRVIAQSISWAYEPGDSPADERTPLDFAAPQPRATTVGAVHALETAVAEVAEHVVLRYGTLYGSGTWYEPNGLVAGRLQRGELPANDGVSSFVHVDDAARAAALALTWPSGVFNIVDDEPAAARAWVPVLARALGEPAPPPVAGRNGWERGASNTMVRSQGWSPAHSLWRTGFSCF